jgi:hypothetical protein
LSARLERFDVTAPIVFVAVGLVLTHGPLAVLGVVLFSVVAHGATGATGRCSPWPRDAMTHPACLSCRHAGSSAGHQPRRRP